VLVAVVRAYQRWVSPMFGPHCRFAPTCSTYAVTALREHGAVRGGWLAVRRIARCHPFNPGGVDPVPPARTDRHRPTGETRC
jgi:putative membrane protein insertion efficiency factor